MMTETEFLAFLDAHEFVYQRVEHPAVFTCAESEAHRPAVSAVSTKNLFLCDKKARRFFLVVTAFEKAVKLDTLAEQLGVANVRFASEENLMRLLGVTRGAVTLMGLANDTEHTVELFMDGCQNLAGRDVFEPSAGKHGHMDTYTSPQCQDHTREKIR